MYIGMQSRMHFLDLQSLYCSRTACLTTERYCPNDRSQHNAKAAEVGDEQVMKTGQEIPEYNHQHFSGHYLYSAPTMHSDMQIIKYIQNFQFSRKE